MLGRLVAAQFELEAALTKLRAGTDGAATARGEISLSDLFALQRSVATASPAALAGMRAEIIAAAANIANDTKQAAFAGSAPAAERLADARTNARSAVRTVMDGMKDFDPYLRFSSAEDEEAYRRREEENRRAIEAALAKHTPAGDLEATRLAERQLADAGAHGAEASPEFAAQATRLAQSRHDLEQAMGDKTPANESVAATAQDKRAEAASASPTDAELADVMATLQSSGVTVRDAQEKTHGVSANVAVADRPKRVLT